MYNEVTGLKSFIINNLNTYIDKNNLINTSLVLDHISASQVVMCYPDPDKYKYKTMIYILGQNETRESFVSYDLATNDVKIYIVVRDDSPDNLTEKANRYTDCLDDLIKADRSIGNTILSSSITSCHFFDGIEALPTIKGFEITLEIKYQA
jgi:hypothetical protein